MRDNNKIRVAIYARVSTDHDEQLYALENQIDWYNPIIESHPEWDVVDKYIDKGITGTSAKKRPRFMSMIADAEQGKFDLIITREVSRFARNTVDTLQYTRKLKSLGVEVYFINDNIRTFDGDGELRLTIMATLAQEESRKISVRVKAGQKTSMEKGVIYGNGNILGYDRVDHGKCGKEYVINEEQAKTVRMIYDMYLSGKGIRAIKNELERAGRKTATGKTNWSEIAISHVLKNGFYCGIITYHKEYTPDYLEQKKIRNDGAIDFVTIMGDHQAIVTEEEFNSVAKIMNERRAYYPSSKIVTGLKQKRDVWARLLVCSCGHVFNRVHWTTKDGNNQYAYRCKNIIKNGSASARKKKGLPYAGFCDSRIVHEEELQDMAKIIFKDCLPNIDKIKEVVLEMVKDGYEESSNERNQVNELVEEKQKLESKLDRLLDMRIDGEISKSIFSKKKSEIDNRLEEISKDIEVLKESVEASSIVDYNEIIDELSKKINTILTPNLDKVDIDKAADVFIEKIIVYDDRFEWYIRRFSNEQHHYNVLLNIEEKKPHYVHSDRYRVTQNGANNRLEIAVMNYLTATFVVFL